jgi:beta-lactamase class D
MKNSGRLIIIVYLFACLASCSVNKAKTDNSLRQYFDENKADGCFTLLNNTNGEITVYNMRYDTMRFSPSTSFNIVNALIGLQTGRITNDTMMIRWDGIKRPDDTCNRDMGMAEAFRLNCTPYFQQVARRTGKDTMQAWIDTLGYGNKNMEGPIDSFWLNNHLKISPDEQLGLVKRLYFDQLPFRKSVQQMVRDLLLQEDNTAYKLSYKYGNGRDEEQNDIGWVTGWIEENHQVYFFASFVKAPAATTDFGNLSLKITKSILGKLGYMKPSP